MVNYNALLFPILLFLCIHIAESSSILYSQELSLKEKYGKAGFEYIGSVEGKVFLRPFYIGNANWTTALSHCYNGGYQLAQITSDAQHNLLLNFAESSVWFWIDGTDFVEEGIWRSIYSGEKLMYFNWSPPAPDGGSEQNCLYWMNNAFYTGMKDGSCLTEVNHILCETKA